MDCWDEWEVGGCGWEVSIRVQRCGRRYSTLAWSGVSTTLMSFWEGRYGYICGFFWKWQHRVETPWIISCCDEGLTLLNMHFWAGCRQAGVIEYYTCLIQRACRRGESQIWWKVYGIVPLTPILRNKDVFEGGQHAICIDLSPSIFTNQAISSHELLRSPMP